MFGSGIGDLNVYVRPIGSGADRKIWGLSGDADNNWYMGQAPVASSQPFKVIPTSSKPRSLNPLFAIGCVFGSQCHILPKI